MQILFSSSGRVKRKWEESGGDVVLMQLRHSISVGMLGGGGGGDRTGSRGSEKGCNSG